MPLTTNGTSMEGRVIEGNIQILGEMVYSIKHAKEDYLLYTENGLNAFFFFFLYILDPQK
jgi:hypothetical protein